MARGPAFAETGRACPRCQVGRVLLTRSGLEACSRYDCTWPYQEPSVGDRVRALLRRKAQPA